MQKDCQNCKKFFIIDDRDSKFYEKVQVPPPTFCAECRLQRRFAWMNKRSIYKRKCDLCGEEKIGVYAPDKPFMVYCAKCWWSDRWDSLQYGRDYDFSRPFFEQFFELMKGAPLLNRFVYEDTMVRSDYTNMANDLKDCYLVFHGENSERCQYSNDISHTNDSTDVSFIDNSELCYDSFNLQKCSRVHYSISSEGCFNSYFLRDCVNSHDCFGCVNLRHKQYYIFNKPYSKAEYLTQLKTLGFDSGSYDCVERFKKQAHEFWLGFPVKYIHARHNADVSGDFILNSKNALYAFNINGVEDSKFCAFLTVPKVRDSYDWTIYGENGELMYEILQAGRNVYNNKFGWCIWIGARDIEYGILNVDSSNCFGCVAVRKKKYCILNKQYSQSEYKSLREKIIKHMNDMLFTDKKRRVYRYGEFFPASLSPFAYNETTAQEEFPLDEKQAIEEGYQWIDKDKYRGEYQITKKADELPDTISEVKDDILKEIIECKDCKRPYRIIGQELKFYRNQHLPLPRFCVECRFSSRIKWKNQFKLYQRKCQCAGANSDNSTYKNTAQHFHKQAHCPNEFETTYASERADIVYCEKCYLQEVV